MNLTALPQVSRTAASKRAEQVQTAILAVLAISPRTTRELYSALKAPRGEVYRMLARLHADGAVDNRTDRRTGPDGEIIGATWALTGQPLPPRAEQKPRLRGKPPAPKPPFVIPAPDPLLAALFGSRP